MKNYKFILEAIHRGIQLALDNIKDVEDNNSISSDIIDTDDIIYDKYRYKNLLNKFECLITQTRNLPACMTVDEFNEFSNMCLKNDIKYKFTDKLTLRAAIGNISHFIPTANLIFLIFLHFLIYLGYLADAILKVIYQNGKLVMHLICHICFIVRHLMVIFQNGMFLV